MGTRDKVTMAAIGFEVLLGALTTTGSLLAFAKLQGLVRGTPVTYKGQNISTWRCWRPRREFLSTDLCSWFDAALLCDGRTRVSFWNILVMRSARLICRGNVATKFYAV